MKTRIRDLSKRIIVFALILLLTFCAMPLSLTAEAGTSDKSLPISVKNYQREIEIELPFLSPGNKEYKWSFPYSDEYFNSSSFVFDPQLAKASLGLEFSAFRYDNKVIPNQYEVYLGAAGFEDIYAFGYDKPTSISTCSGVIAHKTIGEYTLIAAVPCGQGYKKEWGGNLDVGNEERHHGFNIAAQLFEKEINNYIEEHELTGTKKLWLSGFSRASAISNLTAADMIESGQFADVFAYLFAVPRTTKKAEAYPGIYNICGAFDPITCFPLETWGFERYGTDVYTPAQETDSNYPKLTALASMVNTQITGAYFRNNPQVNYRVHLIVEFLAELFPTAEDYTDELQENIMKIWTDPENMDFIQVFTQVISMMEDLDQRQTAASNTFLDYLSLMASEHLSGETGTNEVYWDPNLSLQVNYMIEHVPYIYLDWVFSENNSADIYDLTADTRRIVLTGDIDTYIYQNGKLMNGMASTGEYVDITILDEDWWMEDTFMQRNGKETIVALPMDKEYTLRIETKKSGYVDYFQILNRADTLLPDDGKLVLTVLDKGIYELVLENNRKVPEIKALDGSIDWVIDVDYTYSPTIMMATEAGGKFHLTVELLINIVMGCLIFSTLLVFVSIVIGIIHRVRKKKRTRPYSNLWVIIPHLLGIAFTTGLTVFLTWNFLQIGAVKMISSTLNLVFVFILALRALIRCLRAKEEKGYQPQSRLKKILGSVYTAALLVLAILNWTVFKGNFFDTYSKYSAEKAATYIAAIALLCLLSILIFPWRQRKKNEEKL